MNRHLFLDHSSPAFVQALTAYMFVDDRPINADYTLVLGMSLWERPLRKAIQLHRANLAGRVVFSGGFNEKIGQPEAIAMLNSWATQGLTLEGVCIDAKATNTYENIANFKQILALENKLRPGLKINLVAINYHMQRVVETFHHVFEGDYELGICSYPSIYCAKDSWHLNPNGRNLIVNEARKILRHLPDNKLPSSLQQQLIHEGAANLHQPPNQ